MSVGHGLRADPTADALHWWPAGARAGADATLFDAWGRRISAEERALYPSRIVVSSPVAPDVSIDLAGGTASRIPLVHPEAVAGADCGAAICDVSGGAIVVGGLTSVSSALAVRLRLAPRVVLRHGDAFEPAPLVSVPVLPCAMTIASGEALRSVDATRAVVRVDARCASEVGDFRWFSAGRMLDALGTEQAAGADVCSSRGRPGGGRGARDQRRAQRGRRFDCGTGAGSCARSAAAPGHTRHRRRRGRRLRANEPAGDGPVGSGAGRRRARAGVGRRGLRCLHPGRSNRGAGRARRRRKRSVSAGSRRSASPRRRSARPS